MSSNQERILQKYGDGTKENRRAEKSRSNALEFRYTKQHLEGFISKTDRVLEFGCATGYYGMYYAEKCREYVGIDIVPGHIEIFQNKIKEAGLNHVSCRVGDATDLTEIPNGDYDVVLCLGPIYHLPPEEQEKVPVGYAVTAVWLPSLTRTAWVSTPDAVFTTNGGLTTPTSMQTSSY